MSSTGALSLQKVPDHMILIGAGVIGVELVMLVAMVTDIVMWQNRDQYGNGWVLW